ncbi:transmembrane protein 222 [Nephila pilipes]|uniref:Transmembrane protein 222 n=1 Tax=Nephila pilipes TaxID=299642 RepID=A0A8X6PZ71_NEPPI|nr:transmembrane protein 222 [Nephila pilipes]
MKGEKQSNKSINSDSENTSCDVPLMDHKKSRYPFCIVWTPLPIITWICPLIGHMGIAMSSGIIRDFAGPYYVSEDDMAFGKPTKYWQLHPDKARGGRSGWDTGVLLFHIGLLIKSPQEQVIRTLFFNISSTAYIGSPVEII